MARQHDATRPPSSLSDRANPGGRFCTNAAMPPVASAVPNTDASVPLLLGQPVRQPGVRRLVGQPLDLAQGDRALTAKPVARASARSSSSAAGTTADTIPRRDLRPG